MKAYLIALFAVTILLSLSQAQLSFADTLLPYGELSRCEDQDDIGTLGYVLSNPVAKVENGNLTLFLDSLTLRCLSADDGSVDWHFAPMPVHSNILASYWANIFQGFEYEGDFATNDAFNKTTITAPLVDIFSPDELCGCHDGKVRKEFHLMLRSDATQGLPAPGRYLLQLEFDFKTNQTQVLQFTLE